MAGAGGGTAQLIMQGAQAGLGIFQALRGSKKRKQALEDYAKNPYQVPESMRRAVEIQGTLAQGTQLPGQDIIEERMASNTANAVAQSRQSSTSPSQVLQATIDSYLAQQQNQANLDLQAAQNYQTMQQGYAQAVSQLAPYEVERWKYNTLYPIQERLNRAGQMEQAGWGNIAAGISGAQTVSANQQYINSLGGQPSGTYGGNTGVGMAPITPIGTNNMQLPYNLDTTTLAGM